MSVRSFILTRLLCFFLITASDVEGYASWCTMNQTIFVPEESTATFLANFTNARIITFLKTDSTNFNIFRARVRYNNITDDDVNYYDRSWKYRTHISSQLNTNGQISVRIDVSTIGMKDNGTYVLYDYEGACFILFVMQIRLEPTGAGAIEENKPVYVYAHPHASVVKRPFANATMVWLLDGLSVNKTASFVQQDGLIWIPRIPGGLDGRNVTYRALHDSGTINDINYTLNVMYEKAWLMQLSPNKVVYIVSVGDMMPEIMCTAGCNPPCDVSWGIHSSNGHLALGAVAIGMDAEYTCIATRKGSSRRVEKSVTVSVQDEQAWSITVAPQKTVYIMSVGETMPEILCTADCNPSCNVSWGIHSPNGELILGTVSKDMKGEYICTATRKGSTRRVEKSVTIHVQDNTSFTIAVACLATFQALTTLGLGLCTFLIYRRNKQSPCKTCFKTSARQSSNRNTGFGSNSTVDDTGLQHYEDLDTDTRYVTTVSREVDLPMTALPTEAGLEIYENTKVTPTSTQGVTLTHK